MSAPMPEHVAKQLDKLKDIGLDIGGASDLLEGAGGAIGDLIGGNKNKDAKDGDEEKEEGVEGLLKDLSPF